jgi:peptide/nickel transport system substrate-binding protein
MRIRALIACALVFVSTAAGAATFRWASQGDVATQDPHAQDEGFTKANNNLVYDRLMGRNKDMSLAPWLATEWKSKSPTTWVFTLRKGVKFHDGTPFTADDVVFSIERAQSPSSNFKVYAALIGKARAIDSHTVEIETPAPSPLLLENLNTVRIMSREWCRKHGALKPQDFKTGEETYASRNANGTGPFTLVRREAEVSTVLRKHPGWWGLREGVGDYRFEGNVDEIVYRPVKSDATRMAALLTGEVDLVLDPPLQDIPRLKRDPAVRVVEGVENRVIFLVLDQARDELKYSNVKGRNPLKDLRVRQAIYQAIDIEAIRTQVMRGLSLPTGAMIPAAGRSFPELEPRLLPFDPAAARRRLAEAGYPDGFELGLLCPNNRYVNDERICTALAAMFAKAGIRVRLDAIPRAQFFQRVDQLDISMHLYGWGGAATDPGFTLTPVLHSRDGKGKGDFNSGRHSDAELDRLVEAIEVEMDPAKRSAMMLAAFRRVRENIYTIPLHRQVIPWAVRVRVTIPHRPDNNVEPLWVRLD